MNSITNLTWIQELKKRADNFTQLNNEKNVKYECEECEDRGFLENEEGEIYFCKCRKLKEARERIEKSGLAHRISENTFKSFKQDHQARVTAVNTCLKYIADFKEKKPSLILMGEVGSGKTHLAIAVANKLLSEYVVKYVTYEQIRELKFCMNDREYYNQKISTFRQVQVLFIDDLFKGLEKNIDIAKAKTELDIVYEIINYRYNNKKPMIITTELDINRLMEIDKALASRILEMAKGYRITFEGLELNYRIFG
jgi:DNA replication protein DnaC